MLCELIDELKAKGSKILSGGSRAVETVTPKPQIRKPTATRQAQTTVEKTKQTLVGTRLKFMKRSNTERQMAVAVAHSVSKLTTLTFSCPEPFYEAMGSVFNASNMEGWYEWIANVSANYLNRLLIGYLGDRDLCFQGSGTAVAELVENLQDDEVSGA